MRGVSAVRNPEPSCPAACTCLRNSAPAFLPRTDCTAHPAGPAGGPTDPTMKRVASLRQCHSPNLALRRRPSPPPQEEAPRRLRDARLAPNHAGLSQVPGLVATPAPASRRCWESLPLPAQQRLTRDQQTMWGSLPMPIGWGANDPGVSAACVVPTARGIAGVSKDRRPSVPSVPAGGLGGTGGLMHRTMLGVARPVSRPSSGHEQNSQWLSRLGRGNQSSGDGQARPKWPSRQIPPLHCGSSTSPHRPVDSRCRRPPVAAGLGAVALWAG